MSHVLNPIYIRAKRNKTNLFLYVNLKDTIAEVKSKLCAALGGDRTPEEIRLFLDKSDAEPALLEDKKTVDQSNVTNDALVFFVFYDKDNVKWEDIHVAEFESLDEGEDEDYEMKEEMPPSSKKEKGKGRA
ncbi:uncharacterized protein BYT42DRAFT_550932 [Radiomyces spectabilis]|uniref:uncharacterized protein n=1 Tax=Radiomyces spectabilis TaxID=64574 RepID=UPI00221E4BE8|nr:uncharacterized protein BYT42DRAFT_550932 [Radiomyces spectabilis]KAI8393403.1 hypothetical protein BYT42DRAFT_550932 [Radiomyces spectabilis]